MGPPAASYVPTVRSPNGEHSKPRYSGSAAADRIPTLRITTITSTSVNPPDALSPSQKKHLFTRGELNAPHIRHFHCSASSLTASPYYFWGPVSSPPPFFS